MEREGESLLEVARQRYNQDIATFLEERVAVRQAVRARDEVGEERPAQRPRVEGEEAEGEGEDELTVMMTDWKERMKNETDTIKLNITRIENEKRNACDLLEQISNELKILEQRKKINEDLVTAKVNELERERAKLVIKETKIKEQKKKLLTMAASDNNSMPECPVCMERLTAEIYSCKNGHGICGTCKPRVNTCATCRDGEYICRNTVMEQMIRAMVQEE